MLNIPYWPRYNPSVRFSVCLAVLLVGIAVNLPVPLYARYADLSGMGGRAFGAAFACYGLGVLPSLFFFGGISDRIGRRLPLILALALSVTAIMLVSILPGLPTLAVARVVQGIAVGLVGASATAFLAESFSDTMAPERAAASVTSMLALGFAMGGLTTGVALIPGPTLFPLSYPLDIAASLIVIAMLMSLRYTVQRRQTPWLRLPYFPPGAAWFCLSIGSAWCLTGTVLSIVPFELSRHGLATWSGLTTFLMPSVGVICQQAKPWIKPTDAVRLGLFLAPLGCVLLTAGLACDSLSLVLGGAAISGAAGLGFSFYGGLAALAMLSGAEKARGAAAFFLSCYVGLCIAPLFLGWLSEKSGTSQVLMLLSLGIITVSGALEIAYQVASRRVAQI